ncbi:MAG: glycosyl transferase, partial [Brevibacterium aurantiacum]|nr:glycosyl transferase [Brevibacterium aurantiacum]
DSEAKNLRNSVAAADGVGEVGPTESGGLWQVDTPYNGRFLVREPDGTLSTAPMDGTTAEVAAGEDGRTLIASDAAGNITASLDGKDLPAPEKPTNDWAAEFSLPASGGDVELSYGSEFYAPGVILGWVLGLLPIIVAIPFGSQRQSRAWSRTTRARSEKKARTTSQRAETAPKSRAPEQTVEAKP